MNQKYKCHYWWEWIGSDPLISAKALYNSTGIREWHTREIYARIVDNKFFYIKEEVLAYLKIRDDIPIPQEAKRVLVFLEMMELERVNHQLNQVEFLTSKRSRKNETGKYLADLCLSRQPTNRV